jgi:glucose-6-phosphate 1-epimerase
VSTAAEAPFVELQAPDGAFARVYLDGGQVASWIPRGSGDDRLFVSRAAQYGPGRSLRGGIPVCFPQFGPFGPLAQHGFARLSRWHVAQQDTDDASARVLLRLTDSAASRAQWPYAFAAELSVQVAASVLTVALTVTNTDTQPFAFTAALHPYFAVAEAYATHVVGLAGTQYRDALRDGAEFHATDDVLAIEGHIDRVYFGTGDEIVLREPHRGLRLEQRGFSETVVWNPGVDGTRARPDFADGDEHRMVCVEAAVVRPPVQLAPGAQWTGAQVMTAIL